jgi:hypothetical protein
MAAGGVARSFQPAGVDAPRATPCPLPFLLLRATPRSFSIVSYSRGREVTRNGSAVSKVLMTVLR